jgi:hypothetical protein
MSEENISKKLKEYLESGEGKESIIKFIDKIGKEREDIISRPLNSFPLEDIIDCLYSIEKATLDYDDLLYRTVDVDFTMNDFLELHQHLDWKYQKAKWKKFEPNMPFEEYRIYFIFNDKKFIWRAIFGQGTCRQFLNGEKDFGNWPRAWPMKFESERAIILE